MLRYHIKLAYRSFLAQKSSFLINLLGLTAGLTCTLLISMWVIDEYSMNKSFSDIKQIYQVMENQDYTDGILTTSSTPGLLAEALREEIPEIEYAVTTTWTNNFTLSYEDKNIKTKGFYVGDDYFEILDFELLEGEPSEVLKDKKSIVLSENTAMNLFGRTTNLIGEMVEFQYKEVYQVSGVFKDLPSNTTYDFDFLLTFEEFKKDNEWVTHWGSNGPRTLVKLQKGAMETEVESKIKDFVKGKNEDSNVSLFLYPFEDMYLQGSFENGVQTGGRIEYVRIFTLIAIFVLVIACINFMNLSTAKAGKRAKEVGVKKSVGAQRASLMGQFLIESVSITFFSLLLSYLLVWILLPEFNEITGKKLVFSFHPNFVLLTFGVALLTGLLAGSYPAFYLSGFNPLMVLKGSLKGTLGELWARKGLVIVQFFLSILLIVGVMVVYQQINYVKSKNLGYNKNQVITFVNEGPLSDNIEPFLNEVRKVPGVVKASSIGHSLLWQNSNTSGLDWPGKDENMQILFENIRVNYDMLELMEVEFLEGRPFSRDFPSDTAKIIINEAGLDVMGLDDPIGQKITLWENYELEIVGIVKNFHFQSLHETINPVFFWLQPEYHWNVMVRIEAGSEDQSVTGIRDLYQKFNPGFAFDYKYLDAQYAENYKSEERIATLLKYFAGFAVLISCLGLFGLASYTAERRVKEIGIRKAMGSSVSQIIYLLTRDFTVLVIVSAVFALPLGYYLMDWWLEDYAYRINLNLIYFGFAGLLSLLIAWLTVGSQAYKAAKVNPAECLRNE